MIPTTPAALEAALQERLAPVARLLGTNWTLRTGWGTVDLERTVAERSLRVAEGTPDEPLLGARARLVLSPEWPVVLLEPTTEGRLAASLARFGEGALALYVRAGADGFERLRERGSEEGIDLSRMESGALGRTVLVTGSSPWGPHLLVTDAPPAGTIGP